MAPPSDHELRTLVAQFWRLRPEEIDDGLVFNASRLRAFSSVRFLTFIAAVESNLGLRVPDPGAITTYGALRATLSGGAPSAATTPSAIPAAVARPLPVAAAPAALAGLRLGQDLEEIASLPETTDYAAHAFYAKNFTTAEIAYCTKQTNPRQHFAVRWCAKEALVKTSLAFEGVPFGAIEVRNDVRGAPSIEVHDARAQAALAGHAVLVSLSHTDTLASAVVLLVPSA